MILDMMGEEDEDDDDVWGQAAGNGIPGGHDSFDQLSLSSSVMGSSADGEDYDDEDAMGRAVLGKAVRQRNAARRQGKVSPSQARCRLVVIISFVLLAMGATLTIFGLASRSQHEALEQEVRESKMEDYVLVYSCSCLSHNTNYVPVTLLSLTTKPIEF